MNWFEEQEILRRQREAEEPEHVSEISSEELEERRKEANKWFKEHCLGCLLVIIIIIAPGIVLYLIERSGYNARPIIPAIFLLLFNIITLMLAYKIIKSITLRIIELKKEGNETKKIILLKSIPVALLLIALINLPYGYYILLRWIISPIFIYLAIFNHKSKEEAWTWIFAVMGGLYNPILSVHLGRDVWRVANIITIGLIIYSFYRKKKDETNKL